MIEDIINSVILVGMFLLGFWGGVWYQKKKQDQDKWWLHEH